MNVERFKILTKGGLAVKSIELFITKDKGGNTTVAMSAVVSDPAKEFNANKVIYDASGAAIDREHTSNANLKFYDIDLNSVKNALKDEPSEEGRKIKIFCGLMLMIAEACETSEQKVAEAPRVVEAAPKPNQYRLITTDQLRNDQNVEGFISATSANDVNFVATKTIAIKHAVGLTEQATEENINRDVILQENGKVIYHTKHFAV